METNEIKKQREESQPPAFRICTGCNYVYQNIQDLVDRDNILRRKIREGWRPWPESNVTTAFYHCPECDTLFEEYVNSPYPRGTSTTKGDI